jgi:hypothetical protein
MIARVALKKPPPQNKILFNIYYPQQLFKAGGVTDTNLMGEEEVVRELRE